MNIKDTFLDRRVSHHPSGAIHWEFFMMDDGSCHGTNKLWRNDGTLVSVDLFVFDLLEGESIDFVDYNEYIKL
jgi:hypothetical protein